MELVLIAILIWLCPDGLPRGRWRRASVVLVTAGVLLGLAARACGVTAVAEHRFQLGSNAGTVIEVHADGAAGIPAAPGPRGAARLERGREARLRHFG